jgi:hypothetical protein
MADERLLTLLQSRVLRWMMLVIGSVTLSSLLVSFVCAALLPDAFYQRLPDAALFWAVILTAAALCTCVEVRSRRGGGGGGAGEGPE